MSKPKREKKPTEPHKPPLAYVVHHPDEKEGEPRAVVIGGSHSGIVRAIDAAEARRMGLGLDPRPALFVRL